MDGSIDIYTYIYIYIYIYIYTTIGSEEVLLFLDY